MSTTQLGSRLAPAALVLSVALWLSVISSACGSAGPVPDPGDPPLPVTLEVVNDTGDTWFIDVGGVPRGSVAAEARLTLYGLPAGHLALIAKNDNLELTQRQQVEIPAGGSATWTLKPIYAELRIINEREGPVEILVDGISIGWARPGDQTVLESVPAGKRMLIARNARGPGAVQARRFLAPGEQAVWSVAPVESSASESTGAPKPPSGKGLLWMHNRSTQVVRLVVDGVERARVASGESTQVIVEPGTHAVIVKIEGVDAKSEQSVTLRPNQVAEWSYGAR